MKEILPTVPVHEIMSALAVTEAGMSLDGMLRWGTYRNKMKKNTWRELLGASAIDTLHSQLMYGVGRAFLIREKGRFSPEQKETFLFGLLSHDFGEAKIKGRGIGDVNALLKTEEHEKIESEMARMTIASLPVSNELKEKLLHGYEHVVEGKDPELHRAFKALEKTEYIMTVLKVFQNSRKRELIGKQVIKNEKEMITSVFVNSLSKVLEHDVQEYPDSIGYWLHVMAPLIDRARAFCDTLMVNGR